jgi:hypothetical protein
MSSDQLKDIATPVTNALSEGPRATTLRHAARYNIAAPMIPATLTARQVCLCPIYRMNGGRMQRASGDSQTLDQATRAGSKRASQIAHMQRPANENVHISRALSAGERRACQRCFHDAIGQSGDGSVEQAERIGDISRQMGRVFSQHRKKNHLPRRPWHQLGESPRRRGSLQRWERLWRWLAKTAAPPVARRWSLAHLTPPASRASRRRSCLGCRRAALADHANRGGIISVLPSTAEARFQCCHHRLILQTASTRKAPARPLVLHGQASRATNAALNVVIRGRAIICDCYLRILARPR